MNTHLQALWSEESAANPPRRVWRDWALLAILIPTAIIEAIIRDDVWWRVSGAVMCIALLFTLLWRRTSPLVATVIPFVTINAVDIIAVSVGKSTLEVYTMGFVLLLPYALFRWGSGRQAAMGAAVMVASLTVTTVVDFTGLGDLIGGSIILFFPAVLGAEVRYMYSSRERGLHEVKLRERETLARELHDTVAHHVSAIVVQAQAGRVVAGAEPAAAVEALEVIEEEASRALSEMRAMVGALRDGEDASLRPQQGIADIEQLALMSTNGAQVDIALEGDLDGLSPAIEATVFRLAQESITNATRHARNATRIGVNVVGDADTVKLRVSDDGDTHSFGTAAPPGFGLLGMSERAKLLGGRLDAGPAEHRGWIVNAVLPRSGASAP